MLACRCGKKEVVELLINNGADVNQKANPYNRGLVTPLSFAISQGRQDIVNILLTYEASL